MYNDAKLWVPKEEDEHLVPSHIADIEAVATASRATELEKQREPREPENPKDPEKRKHTYLVAKESRKERDNPKHGVTHKEFDIAKTKPGTVQELYWNKNMENQKHG